MRCGLPFHQAAVVEGVALRCHARAADEHSLGDDVPGERLIGAVGSAASGYAGSNASPSGLAITTV
ncbi:MAG TPA: hypothetical protein VHN80_13660 [Kineosporiaceae bacterium]|nr:hypothetical protein [Kineosporiaceae bacterium]